ncbi:MAG: tetratricopeptide repeat protein [Cyanobacteriota bacterium]|nr:tetratricopeptide repeat protein [Cyanobacteriota bacterium]
MNRQRNRWLIGTVLILALAAFLSLSLLPILGGNAGRQGRTPGNGSTPVDPASRQGELEAQARGYELVLEREPDNQTALKGLVETRIQLGDLQGVVPSLEKLAAQNPTVSEYQVLLAQTKQQLGDLDGAADLYRQILDQNPGDMNALQGLTALLVQQKRPQAAIGLLQETLANASKNPSDGTTPKVDTLSVQLLLAQVYVEGDQIDKAMGLYDQAIASAPQDFRPVLAKALVMKQQGDQKAAQALFDQATAMAPAQFKDQISQMAQQPAPTNSAPDTPTGAASESPSPAN